MSRGRVAATGDWEKCKQTARSERRVLPLSSQSVGVTVASYRRSPIVRMETPISLLQEFCVRNLNGQTPEYQLLASEALMHATQTTTGTKFAYRVVMGNMSATATGRSKKQAKHAAALSLLQSLVRCFDDPVADSHKFAVNVGGDGVDERPDDVPTDSGMNSVGMLQEVCMREHWKLPRYQTYGGMGTPQEPMFRMVCEVSCGDTVIRSEGTARSKKLAKRFAAIQMIAKLEAHNCVPISRTGAPSSAASSSAVSSSAGHRPEAARATGNPLIHESGSTKRVNAYEKLVAFMKRIGGDLNQLLDPLFDESKDPIESLSTVADFLECEAEFHSVPSPTDECNVVAHLQPIDKFQTPIAVKSGWGIGKTPHAAQEAAARRLLLNLAQN